LEKQLPDRPEMGDACFVLTDESHLVESVENQYYPSGQHKLL